MAQRIVTSTAACKSDKNQDFHQSTHRVSRALRQCSPARLTKVKFGG